MWYGWESIGGKVDSDLAAVSWGKGRVDLFAKNESGELEHLYQDDGEWSNWQNLGGQINTAPVAISTHERDPRVFARGNDGALWYKPFNGKAWQPWRSLGGKVVSKISVCSWGEERVDVFMRGEDDALWHRSAQGESWTEWESLGGKLTSEVSAVSAREGHIEVFACGTDKAIWRLRYHGKWEHWSSVGGSLTSGVCAVALEDELHLFGRDATNSLCSYAEYGKEKTDWISLNRTPNKEPYALRTGPREVTLFSRGPDDAIYLRTKKEGNWAPWESLGGEVRSAPAATSRKKDGLKLFVVGTDKAIWSRRRGSE